MPEDVVVEAIDEVERGAARVVVVLGRGEKADLDSGGVGARGQPGDGGRQLS
jgi:hypothetical protein